MTTATVPAEVMEYLGEVRAELRDLPLDEREDLLAEVESSLLDAAAEGGSLVARLGPPEEFAAELRAAAGLHATDAAPRESRLAAWGRSFVADERVATARRVASELAPIWWLARGYVVVGAAALLFDTQWSTRLPVIPRVGDSTTWGIAAIALASIVSIALGLRQRRYAMPFPNVVLALNVALAFAAIPIAQRAMDVMPFVAVDGPTPQPPAGVISNGARVDNIYPFTRDGRLLHDVLLYDGAGRPLDIPTDRLANPNQRFVVTNGNKPLFNVFPIRYYEPGSRRVARPNAAPYIELPLVRTPPLPKRITP